MEKHPIWVFLMSKAAFFDEVGHSMVNDLKALAERTYSDEEFRERAVRYDYRRPFTKESLLNRELFERFYSDRARMIPDYWMPNRTWPDATWTTLPFWYYPSTESADSHYSFFSVHRRYYDAFNVFCRISARDAMIKMLQRYLAILQ